MIIEDIISLENQLIEAIKLSDIAFLENYLHNDLLFIAPNGQIITKEIDLKSHRSGEMKVDHINATFEEIKIIDDTIIVVITYQTKGTFLGNLIDGEFRYIRFWRKFDNHLKIIGGSCLRIN